MYSSALAPFYLRLVAGRDNRNFRTSAAPIRVRRVHRRRAWQALNLPGLASPTLGPPTCLFDDGYLQVGRPTSRSWLLPKRSHSAPGRHRSGGSRRHRFELPSNDDQTDLSRAWRRRCPDSQAGQGGAMAKHGPSRGQVASVLNAGSTVNLRRPGYRRSSEPAGQIASRISPLFPTSSTPDPTQK